MRSRPAGPAQVQSDEASLATHDSSSKATRDVVLPSPGPSHIVQFYENDAFLSAAVADFLAAGLTIGQSAIVIATKPHRDAFAERLALEGVDIDGARRSGRLTELDARKTLATLMVDARPDADAEAANRGKSEFLAVMSHELRTPLNAIGGYVEILSMGIRGPITAAQRDDLERIQTSQRHLLGLINDVLNYAKLETGNVSYDMQDVLVRSELAKTEGLVTPQARAKGLRLVMAECPSELTVRADAAKLRQILVNLLSNAIKFTDRGGSIDLECVERGADVAFLVRDTGIGIPAAKLDAIFEPFVQVRAGLTRVTEGTGLGLAISRDLARAMGGNLTVESTSNAGSTFVLTLPRGS